MKEAKGFKWLILFISQIVFSPLLQVILYKYVAVTQGWQQPTVGFFRTLLFVYLIPFLVSVFVLIYTIVSKHNDIMKNPYQMKFSQMVILGVLSVITIISDYSAVVEYAQMKNVKSFSQVGFEFRLPFYLGMKLTLTPLFTHLFSVWLLNRHFVFGTIWYFLVSLFGLFLYEFTVWDVNNKSVSFDYYASFLGGFKFIIPKIYSVNFSSLFVSETPNFFQWLPHILMALSSLCNGLIPVVTKSFLVKAAHEAKNLQYQSQKTKLKDG